MKILYIVVCLAESYVCSANCFLCCALSYLIAQQEQAGDKLKGKVQINTVKPMKPCRMELFFVGKEKTMINKVTRNEDSDSEEERVIISTSIPLHRLPSECDLSFRIVYTYPFEIDLPMWLPSSMAGCNFGSKWQVQYKLWVCAYPHRRGGEFSVVHNLGERSVNIVSSPLGLRNISNRSINFPVSYQDSRHLTMLGGTFHKGFVSLCMYIPNGEVSKGRGNDDDDDDDDDGDENIIMYLRLRNDSTCIIQHVNVELQETVKWFAKGIVTSSNRTVVQLKGLTEERVGIQHGHVGIQQGIQPITSRTTSSIPMDYPNLCDMMHQIKERREVQDKLIMPLPTPSSSSSSKLIHYESYKGQLIHIQYYIVVSIITKNPLVNNVIFEIPITIGF